MSEDKRGFGLDAQRRAGGGAGDGVIGVGLGHNQAQDL